MTLLNHAEVLYLDKVIPKYRAMSHASDAPPIRDEALSENKDFVLHKNYPNGKCRTRMGRPLGI